MPRSVCEATLGDAVDVRAAHRRCCGVIRDGIVVFPRKALEAFLASRAGSLARPGRKELTRALKSLGGGDLDVPYFAGSGRIRAWFCPLPMPDLAAGN